MQSDPQTVISDSPVDDCFCSEDYPVGGMVEPYDIQMEKELFGFNTAWNICSPVKSCVKCEKLIPMGEEIYDLDIRPHHNGCIDKCGICGLIISSERMVTLNATRYHYTCYMNEV